MDYKFKSLLEGLQDITYADMMYLSETLSCQLIERGHKALPVNDIAASLIDVSIELIPKEPEQ